jgi:hypothetical protein
VAGIRRFHEAKMSRSPSVILWGTKVEIAHILLAMPGKAIRKVSTDRSRGGRQAEFAWGDYRELNRLVCAA